MTDKEATRLEVLFDVIEQEKTVTAFERSRRLSAEADVRRLSLLAHDLRNQLADLKPKGPQPKPSDPMDPNMKL